MSSSLNNDKMRSCARRLYAQRQSLKGSTPLKHGETLNLKKDVHKREQWENDIIKRSSFPARPHQHHRLRELTAGGDGRHCAKP